MAAQAQNRIDTDVETGLLIENGVALCGVSGEWRASKDSCAVGRYAMNACAC
jgi:hypothetical protein